MNKCPLLAIAMLVTVATGCTSFSAVHLHRDENNMSWTKKRLLHGIPITLKVPTHVKVDVLDKHVLLANEAGIVTRSSPGVPIRQVDTSFIQTEKIFLVDIKRPAAGTLDATIDLDPESQYFKNIKTELEDKTISEVGGLIAAIAPGGLFGMPTAETDATTSTITGVKVITNVVASQIFEVEDPNFEMNLMEFLDRHVNCCHNCSVVQHDQNAPVPLPSIHESGVQEVTQSQIEFYQDPSLPAQDNLFSPTANPLTPTSVELVYPHS